MGGRTGRTVRPPPYGRDPYGGAVRRGRHGARLVVAGHKGKWRGHQGGHYGGHQGPRPMRATGNGEQRVTGNGKRETGNGSGGGSEPGQPTRNGRSRNQGKPASALVRGFRPPPFPSDPLWPTVAEAVSPFRSLVSPFPFPWWRATWMPWWPRPRSGGRASSCRRLAARSSAPPARSLMGMASYGAGAASAALPPVRGDSPYGRGGDSPIHSLSLRSARRQVSLPPGVPGGSIYGTAPEFICPISGHRLGVEFHRRIPPRISGRLTHLKRPVGDQDYRGILLAVSCFRAAIGRPRVPGVAGGV
jgi:hypothetical protein